MTLALPTALLVLSTCLWLWLAERDHRRRRRMMGLQTQPSPIALYWAESRRARERAEARIGR